MAVNRTDRKGEGIMTRIAMALAPAVCAALMAGPPGGPPPLDPRLPASTLVREDIFAGFVEDDLERLSRGERNIELLMERRPGERPTLLDWKASAALYRAVRALEDKGADEFRELHRRAADLFAEARKVGPKDLGVDAITGGTYVIFADRLPEELRGAAWSQAYDAYRRLWEKQAAVVGRLPTHLRG